MHWRNVIALAGAVFALALSLAAVGCGSSGDAAELIGTMSKARYLKLAIQTCKLGGNEITNYYGQWEKAHTVNGKRPPEAARDNALDHVSLKVKTKELQRLKEIGLPREGEYDVKKIYAAWEEGIENGEEDPRSMQESNYLYAFANAYRRSIDFGLQACWLG
jgi:hypothetical protein